MYTYRNRPKREFRLMAEQLASYSDASTYTDSTACGKNCKAWER